jgi:putative polyhydroxyalkanoate system protein
MPTIDIRRSHGGNLKDAKAAIERVAKAIGKEYGIAHQWDGNEMTFTRSGVKGRIHIAGDDVHVHAELGMLVGAMKSTIEREIRRRLDDEFGVA